MNKNDWAMIVDHRNYLCRSKQILHFPKRAMKWVVYRLFLFAIGLLYNYGLLADVRVTVVQDYCSRCVAEPLNLSLLGGSYPPIWLIVSLVELLKRNNLTVTEI